MSLLSPEERAFAAAVARAAYCNPFAPDRIAAERQALGGEFVADGASWNVDVHSFGHHANITRLTERTGALATACRERLEVRATAPSDADLRAYEDVALFFLYHRHYPALTELLNDRLAQPAAPARPARVACYADFARDVSRFFDVPGLTLPAAGAAPHLFACFFQLRRAFHYTFTHIVGSSDAAWRLRAAVWESIFTHDLRRYRTAVYPLMGDITTLVTGPSGTGKELVARAIGLARYVPFDPKSAAFAEDFLGSFHALSLSALSPTLIESELFGHRRGAYTGALEDRAGWLETCRPLGTVFLDEIGEVDVPVQVKLLRVLQSRTFQRLGETADRPFAGKIIAATNRDLRAEMEAGRFREDFYYRLCSDLVATPSLSDLLGPPGPARDRELRGLVTFIARKIVPADRLVADALAEQVADFSAAHLGPDYPWPGNFRELEQCVRNVLVRGAYRPASAGKSSADLAAALDRGDLTADDLLRRYCAVVYAHTGSYEETARRLGIDRRTVKAKVTHSP